MITHGRGTRWPLIAAVLAGGVAFGACTGTTATPAGSSSPPAPSASTTAGSSPPTSEPPLGGAPSSRASATPAGSPVATDLPIDAVWIPGTHVALVPPPGWEPADSFSGFQHDASGSSIVVAELPTGYASLAPQLTDAGFAGQGIEVTKREEVTVNGLPALLVEGRQPAPGRGVFGKVLLVTGTSSASALVTGNYPEAEANLRDALVAAVKTVRFDPDRPTDPEDALSFTVTPATPLRMAGVIGNGAAFNVSGQLPSKDPAEPVFIVAPSLGAAPVGDVEAFARQRLAQTPQVVQQTIEEVSDISMADMDGIEIIAAGRDDDSGAGVVLYQVLLVADEGGGYVLMTGIAPEADRTEALRMFRSTAETFAFKR